LIGVVYTEQVSGSNTILNETFERELSTRCSLAGYSGVILAFPDAAATCRASAGAGGAVVARL